MRSELEQRLRNYLENYGQRGMASLDIPEELELLCKKYQYHKHEGLGEVYRKYMDAGYTRSYEIFLMVLWPV